MKCYMSPCDGKKPFLFFSFCPEDEAAAFAIMERLSIEGFRVWYDDDSLEGKAWQNEITSRLANCAVLVSVLSDQAIRSHRANSERTYAVNHSKPLVAVAVEQLRLPLGIELQLKKIPRVDFSTDEKRKEDFFRQLMGVSSLAECRDDRRASAEELEAWRRHCEEYLHPEAGEFSELTPLEVTYVPPKPRHRRVLARITNLETGEIFEMCKDEIVLGRDPRQADMLISQDARMIGRYHADILYVASHFFLRDHFAKNGTFYRGKQLEGGTMVELFPEDEFALADKSFRFAPAVSVETAEIHRKTEEEAHRKAEEEAHRKAEEEARRKAEEEARRKAEEEARRKAEEEARRKAEEEARRKAEEEARRKAEEEARREAEENEPSLDDTYIPPVRHEENEPSLDDTYIPSVRHEENEPSLDDTYIPTEQHEKDTPSLDDTYVPGRDDNTIISPEDLDVTAIMKPKKRQVLAYLIAKDTGELFKMEQNEVTIGREKKQAAFYIPDETRVIGRQHADIIYNDSRFFLKDDAAKNGTFHDGERLEESAQVELRELDEFTLADKSFLFVSGEAKKNIRKRKDGKGIAWLKALDTGEIRLIGDEPFCLDRHHAWNDGLLTAHEVSRDHAIIIGENGRFQLIDTKSTNGTFLNGERLEHNKPAELKDGDEITIWKERFQFSVIEPERKNVEED